MFHGSCQFVSVIIIINHTSVCFITFISFYKKKTQLLLIVYVQGFFDWIPSWKYLCGYDRWCFSCCGYDIAKFSEGGYFGEWTLLGEYVDSLHIVALGDVVCVVLTKEKFELVIGPVS